MLKAKTQEMLSLSESERAELVSMARSRSLPAALAMRARIVLACEPGTMPVVSIARDLGINRGTVATWRDRYIRHRISGLYDELRPGRPRTVDDERVAQFDCHDVAHKASGRRHSLEYAGAGREHRHQQEHSAAVLADLQPQAASGGELQAVDGCAVHREAARCCGSVPEPTGQRAGAVRGREEPVPGTSCPPTRAGSIRWSASSRSSPPAPSAEARSTASKT